MVHDRSRGECIKRDGGRKHREAKHDDDDQNDPQPPARNGPSHPLPAVPRPAKKASSRALAWRLAHRQSAGWRASRGRQAAVKGAQVANCNTERV